MADIPTTDGRPGAPEVEHGHSPLGRTRAGSGPRLYREVENLATSPPHSGRLAVGLVWGHAWFCLTETGLPDWHGRRSGQVAVGGAGVCPTGNL